MLKLEWKQRCGSGDDVALDDVGVVLPPSSVRFAFYTIGGMHRLGVMTPRVRDEF